jgi:hypothetical protein
LTTTGTCTTAFGDSDDVGVTLHFDSVQEAAHTLAEAGWWVTTTGVQCETCAARQACATLGHVWTDWHDCGCGCHDDGTRSTRTHTQPAHTRFCDTCDQWEWQEESA